MNESGSLVTFQANQAPPQEDPDPVNNNSGLCMVPGQEYPDPIKKHQRLCMEPDPCSPVKKIKTAPPQGIRIRLRLTQDYEWILDP